jgi:hypothetical protein
MLSSPPAYASLVDEPRLDPFAAIVVWSLASALVEAVTAALVWSVLAGDK